MVMSAILAVRMFGVLVTGRLGRGGRDALGKAHAAGHPVGRVRVGDTFAAFAIEEKTDAIPKPPPPPGSYSYGPRYERRPNGKLVVVIRNRRYSGERQRWSDAKRQRLEDQLNDFVVALIEAAESLRFKAIENTRSFVDLLKGWAATGRVDGRFRWEDKASPPPWSMWF